MAGTKITVDEINTEMNAAITAFRAGDLVTAYTHARAAQMMLAVKPDTSFSDEELSFDREWLNELVKQLKAESRAQTSCGRITQIQVLPQPTRIGYDDVDFYR
jgi:hypothetical protein